MGKAARFWLTGWVAVGSLVALACETSPPPPTTAAPDPVDTVEVGGQTITATAPSHMTVEMEPTDLGSLPPLPPGANAPVGALGIEVTGLAFPGEAATLTIQLENPVDGIRKLIGGAWDEFLPDGTTGATLSPDGLTITLELVDGERGDNDGIANRVISDPVVPIEDSEVEILTSRTPLMTLNAPYEFQLESDGPDPEAITWSLLQGFLPVGVTLDESGLVSGTASGHVGIARVQATDGTTTDTKLLLFWAGSANPSQVVPTGAPLPDGSEVLLLEPGSQPPYTAVLSGYSTDGTAQRQSTIGIADLNTIFGGGSNRPLDPTGTKIAINLTGVEGRLDIVDADTGATLANVLNDPAMAGSGNEFSANGSYMLIKGGTGRIYDTTTGALVRELSDGFPTWTSDTELVTTSGGSSGVIDFMNASDEGLDRSVSIPLECGTRPVAVSQATNRMALTCPYMLKTISMTDGSDVRAVTSACVPAACGIVQAVHFSPSGSHLVFAAGDYSTHSVVVAPDAEGAVLTPLAEPGQIYPVSWR